MHLYMNEGKGNEKKSLETGLASLKLYGV